MRARHALKYSGLMTARMTNRDDMSWGSTANNVRRLNCAGSNELSNGGALKSGRPPAGPHVQIRYKAVRGFVCVRLCVSYGSELGHRNFDGK